MTAQLGAEAFAAALAALPACGEARLRALLGWGAPTQDPREVWRVVSSPSLLAVRPDLVPALGRDPRRVAEAWRRAAGATDPADVWSALRRAGVGVWVHGGPGYPHALVADPAPPAVLFWRGDAAAVDVPGVALVGTRRCTSYGAEVARELGRELSRAGAAVVSGLALGIDGAAHEGALAGAADGGAPPVAVVGSGLDVVYPPRHRALWRRVADVGIIVTEAPLGTFPEPWRFPRRNRILAGLSRVVVVVESHSRGGSLSTVRAAVERGLPVMAVPGSIRSPSSVGTNRLLADGVAPVTDAADVLTALSLEGVVLGHPEVRSPAAPASGQPPAPSDPADEAVLAAVDWTPTTTEEVLRRTGLGVAEASARLVGLEIRGLVRDGGGWWERTGSSGYTTERGYTAPT